MAVSYSLQIRSRPAFRLSKQSSRSSLTGCPFEASSSVDPRGSVVASPNRHG